MNLYEIAEEYQQAFSEIMEMDDIEPSVVDDTLAIYKDNFDNKAIAIASHIKNLEADIKIIKEHEKTISARKKTIERKQGFFKEYLVQNMLKVKAEKIKGKLLNVTLLKPRKVIKISDDNKIPLDYVEFERKLNLQEIKKLLVEGNEIPGAELADGNYSLRIG